MKNKTIDTLRLNRIKASYSLTGGEWIRVKEMWDGEWGYYFINTETGQVRDLLGNILC